ncbi:MAG: UDP-2,4-diacetamido-2,4,6-trideoxy-beta-L-altropyranose hydrolase, partial [Proteobacteria bacterium]|nr:UDP-2,4-diacetamido-2,4,6-trideoxy-beta-L-altropyranose hydrolase [Pseudomonadota bacterium]
MRIVIRADASLQIGTGHVMRCLVLAKQLSDQGHFVSFASRPQAGDLIEFIRRQGIDVIPLDPVAETGQSIQ